MKKEELLQVYAMAETLWGTFKPTDDDIKKRIQNQLWYDLLKPYDLRVIRTAMVEQSKVSDFCNIGKIANECENIMAIANNEIVDDDAVLKEIDRAICAYDKKEAFDNLSEIAKSVVVSHTNLVNWALCDIDEFNTVIVSNLRKSIKEKKALFMKKRSLSANLQIGLDQQQQKQIDHDDDEKKDDEE